MAAGAAAGATSAALNGGNIIQGAVVGTAMGAVGGMAVGVVGPIPVLVGGAAYATATGGLNGLAYYAGGVLGGIAGYKGAMYGFGGSETGGGATCKTLSKASDVRMIQNDIGNVHIDYAPGAMQEVYSNVANRFEAAVGTTSNENPDLTNLYISSTSNGSHLGACHSKLYAIDISRVNGITIGGGYGSNALVTNVVESLQNNLLIQGAYENYGPFLVENASSNYPAWLINLHTTHIHYSLIPGW